MKFFLKIFEPSWKKVIITFILLVLAFGGVYWIFGNIMGCGLGWACERITLIPFFGWLSLFTLVLPVYCFLGMFQIIFGDLINFLEKGNIWIYIFVLCEIIYLYLLAGIILYIIKKYKEW